MEKVKINNIKCENAICHVCLSADRNLFSINLYLDIFYKLCENFKAFSTPLLCWECTALLKKIRIFQNNAKLSHGILYQQIHQQNTPIPKLSKLETIKDNNIFNYTYIEKCELELNVADTKTSIKEESNVTIEDNIELNGIKEESFLSETEDYFIADHENDIATVKKEKTKVRMKHKVLMGKLCEKELDKLTLKVPMQCYDVKVWLDKERHSAEYMQWEFRCDKCVWGWRKETNLLEHNKRCHDPRSKYECDVCSRRFLEKRRLSLHLNSHRYIRECRSCAYRAGKFEMKRHLATHGPLVQCLECEAKFTNQRLFYRHYKDLHEKFICDHCGKVCKSKSVIAKHINLNHVAFECKICDVSFKRRATYLQHRNKKHAISNGEDAYCAPCDKTFFNVYVYRSHLKYSGAHAHERKTGRERAKVSCPDCGRLYSRKSYMMNHYRYVHMKRSNYHCGQCDKYFLNSTKYIDHVKYRHEGATKVKNKLCNICGRGFAANRTLLNHIRTHSGERPYECEYCGAKFIQKYAMLSHVSHIHLKTKRR